MKNIRIFLSENFHFLVVKFSVYLNRHVFVMDTTLTILLSLPRRYSREIKYMSYRGDYEIQAGECKEAFRRVILFCRFTVFQLV